ncbi:DUF4241 domain-containing protein [Bacillus pumilus]|uniref:DUF4241 domain-containing protein n=1 Tax=Bacillus pumilus TaxID=1408 RepID=UPI001C243192|nr:DUF4241 domain-containing protein [Bacillus pumilus]MBU8695582.1 DUF4241 domain-containing protein [Bacillus pumilus]
MIKFTNEQAIECEIATRVKEDELFGYGVNTGMGCFMDAEAARYLQDYEDKRYKEDNDFYFYEEFAEGLEQNTSIHGTGSLPVFMTRWILPCLQQVSATGCIQVFGTGCKWRTHLPCDGFSYNGLVKNP